MAADGATLPVECVTGSRRPAIASSRSAGCIYARAPTPTPTAAARLIVPKGTSDSRTQ